MKRIKIGEGLDELKFGMTREEVVTLIGKADEIEKNAAELKEGPETEDWHFDELGISISFDGEYDFRLTTIAVSEKGFELNGEEYIGSSSDKIEELMKKTFLCDLESNGAEDDQEMLSCDEMNIDFYLVTGRCIEIQWGTLFDDDGEVVWA